MTPSRACEHGDDTRQRGHPRWARALITELRASHQVAGIRIVGGAALALRYFDVEKADALPTFGRRPVQWETIYAHDGIVIQVAAKDAMLAMKLRANRPGRDTNDIRQLLRLCDVTTLDDAEELYEDFYPGDALSDRAVKMVVAILEGGLPDEVRSPGPIEL